MPAEPARGRMSRGRKSSLPHGIDWLFFFATTNRLAGALHPRAADAHHRQRRAGTSGLLRAARSPGCAREATALLEAGRRNILLPEATID